MVTVATGAGRATMPHVRALTPRDPRSRRATAVLLAAGLALTACGGDDTGDAERFCGEVAANREALTNPQLQYSDDVGPLLDLYREVGELAPIAIEAEWDQLVAAYETASTVVAGDSASEQEAVAAIYSSERAAAAIERWLQDNCAVDIGPVFTIVEQNG